MNDLITQANFKGVVRLFPLPNLVLFPQVVQGLHIYEPRYRQLVVDVLAEDQMMALVLLKPGWEDEAEGKPPIESIACLGRVSWYDKLPDGRYNLRVRGLSRIRIIEEIPNNRLYRSARASLMPDESSSSPQELKSMRRELADEVLPRFATDGEARKQLQELFDGEMHLGQVCDVLSYALPFSMEIKQSLLAETVAERRVTAMIDAIRASTASSNRKFPPDFSAN